jgi:hypothetical protein
MMTGCGVHAGSAEMIFKRRLEMKLILLFYCLDAIIVPGTISCMSSTADMKGISLFSMMGMKMTLFLLKAGENFRYGAAAGICAGDPGIRIRSYKWIRSKFWKAVCS